MDQESENVFTCTKKMDWMSPGMRLRPLAARDLPVNRFPCYDVSSRFLSIFPVVRIPTQFSSEPTVYLSLVSSSMVFYPYEPCKKTATWDSQKAFMWRCWFAIYVCGFTWVRRSWVPRRPRASRRCVFFSVLFLRRVPPVLLGQVQEALLVRGPSLFPLHVLLFFFLCKQKNPSL